MPLVVALILIFGLLVFMWIAVGREPGPGPADVAIAYENAWNELDFDLLFELSGTEMRDGLRKDRFVAAKRAAYERGDVQRRLDAKVTVETSVKGHQTSLVVTRIDVDAATGEGGTIFNNVMLERRANGWVVVSYALRTDAPL
jgi:hypothetical protein